MFFGLVLPYHTSKIWKKNAVFAYIPFGQKCWVHTVRIGTIRPQNIIVVKKELLQKSPRQQISESATFIL